MPVTNKTDINLVQYIPIYKKYFKCKDEELAYLYMEFQYLLFIFKDSYHKESDKNYCPGYFLEKITHGYKKGNELFISANSTFNQFLEKNSDLLQMFFAIIHEMRQKDQISLTDGKISRGY